MSLTLKIILGILALAFGIWLGLPGRYTQTPDEIEQEMKRHAKGSTYRVKRSFTPFAWLQRRPSARSGRHAPRGHRPFHLESPAPNDDEKGRKEGE